MAWRGGHLISKRVGNKMNLDDKETGAANLLYIPAPQPKMGKSVMHMAARLKFCSLVQACI